MPDISKLWIDVRPISILVKLASRKIRGPEFKIGNLNVILASDNLRDIRRSRGIMGTLRVKQILNMLKINKSSRF